MPESQMDNAAIQSLFLLLLCGDNITQSLSLKII